MVPRPLRAGNLSPSTRRHRSSRNASELLEDVLQRRRVADVICMRIHGSPWSGCDACCPVDGAAQHPRHRTHIPIVVGRDLDIVFEVAAPQDVGGMGTLGCNHDPSFAETLNLLRDVNLCRDDNIDPGKPFMDHRFNLGLIQQLPPISSAPAEKDDLAGWCCGGRHGLSTRAANACRRVALKYPEGSILRI